MAKRVRDDKVREEILKIFKKNGIDHYITVFNDPKTKVDRVMRNGSELWILGAATAQILSSYHSLIDKH